MPEKLKVAWANHSGVPLKWILMSKEGTKEGVLQPKEIHFETAPDGGAGAGWRMDCFSEAVTSAIPPPESLAALLIALKSKAPAEEFDDLQRIITEVRRAL
jgi:hypothetical protein